MIDKDTNLNEREKTSGRTRTQSSQNTPILRGETSPERGTHIKVGRHAGDLIMTQKSRKKQEEMLNQVALPDNPRTPEEKTKIFAQLVGRAMGIREFSDRENCPERIGFNLSNQVQRNILFAVLKKMTETNYQGDLQIPNSVAIAQTYTDNPEKTSTSLTEGFNITSQKHIGGALANIPHSPVWRVSQRDLIIQSGYDPDNGSDGQRVADEIRNLATKQNFLMWTRLKRDNKGKRVINPKTKKQEFELVSTFSPVLWVNFVSDPKTGKFLYYEICPSPVFLDEVSAQYGGGKNGYFILIPEEANKEIQTTYKKMFKYRAMIATRIQTFCFWLRLRVVELQGKVNNPFSRHELDPVIRISYEEICQQLNIPESSMKTQKKRTTQQIEDGIKVSKEIGYITEGEFDPETNMYILTLNFDFYPPFRKKDSEGIEEPEEQELLPPDSTTM